MFNYTINASAIPFSLEEATTQLEPLFLLIIGIAVYAIFIFRFYRFLAREDIFELNLYQYNTAKHPTLKKLNAVLLYILEYILIFPLFVIIWTIIMTFFLAIISKVDFNYILLAAMSLVAATRITAYYNEDLSKDLAKMVPFALLGILLVDYSYIVLADVWQIFIQIGAYWKFLFYYLILAMVLELVLRIIKSIVMKVKGM